MKRRMSASGHKQQGAQAAASARRTRFGCARAHVATSPSVASSHLARACCARVLMCCAPRPRAHGAGAYQLRVADAQAPDATDGERPIARRLGRSARGRSLACARARGCVFFERRAARTRSSVQAS